MPDFSALQNFADNIDADIESDEELSGDENELMVGNISPLINMLHLQHFI